MISGDNLHEMSKPIFLGEKIRKKKQKTKNLISDEFAQREVKVNEGCF